MSAQILAAANATVDLRPFLNYPAGIPPPGVKPNYVNPPRSNLDMIATTSVFTAIMMVMLAARVWCLLRVRHSIATEDVTCFIGAIGAALCYVSVVWNGTAGPMGYQSYDLKVYQLASDVFFEAMLMFSWGMFIATVFLKLSFFVMFWKIFNPIYWVRISLLIGGTIFTLISGVSGILILWGLTPQNGETYLQHLNSPHDKIPAVLALPLGAVALAADIFILVLPMLALRGLRMRRERKWAVAVVFLAGFLACAASTVNMCTRRIVYESTNDSIDLKWVLMSSTIEYEIGACCCCAPSISQLLHTSPFFRKLNARLASLFCCTGGRGRRNPSSTAVGTEEDTSVATYNGVPQEAAPRAVASIWDHILPQSMRRTFLTTAPAGPTGFTGVSANEKTYVDGMPSLAESIQRSGSGANGSTDMRSGITASSSRTEPSASGNTQTAQVRFLATPSLMSPIGDLYPSTSNSQGRDDQGRFGSAARFDAASSAEEGRLS